MQLLALIWVKMTLLQLINPFLLVLQLNSAFLMMVILSLLRKTNPLMKCLKLKGLVSFIFLICILYIHISLLRPLV